MNISIDLSMFDGINLANPTWDTFIILFYLVAVVLYSFFASRERLSVVLMSIYSALAITFYTPFIQTSLKNVHPDQFFQYRLGIFVGTMVILYTLLTRNMSLRAEQGHAWWQAVVLSCLQVGLLMTCIIMLLPPGAIDSSIANYLFTGELPQSIWMLAPIAGMLVIRPRRDPRN